MSLMTLLGAVGLERVSVYVPCDPCVLLYHYYTHTPGGPVPSYRDPRDWLTWECDIDVFHTAATDASGSCSAGDRNLLDAELARLIPYADAYVLDTSRREVLDRLRWAHFCYAHPSRVRFGSEALGTESSLYLNGTIWHPMKVLRRVPSSPTG